MNVNNKEDRMKAKSKFGVERGEKGWTVCRNSTGKTVKKCVTREEAREYARTKNNKY